MKRILAVAIVIAIVFSTTMTIFATETFKTQYCVTDVGMYELFINYVDGYSLYIDKNMNVDMRNSSVGAILENENKRIEIYKQSLNGIDKEGYISFSNNFLSNTNDHHLLYNKVQNINGYDVNIVVWNRNKLSRVENDKNYYICLDIEVGSYCYTIFIKSADPITNIEEYTYLVKNFTTFEPTQSPKTEVTQVIDVEDKNWNEETKEFYNTYFAFGSELTWGIFEPETAKYNYNLLNYFEDFFEYKFPIILNYSEFENKDEHPNLKNRLDMAHSQGKTLELTLQTAWQTDGNMVYDVLDGEYDGFLRNYAKVIADFGHPVLFRLGNEMNGDWCPYSSHNTSKDTMIYKEFYKYVYSFFEEVDAQNVLWIWNPNAKSYPGFKWNSELMYYPGDKYVDIVGMTAYNTGTYYASSGEKWEEFDELYNDLYYTYCKRYQQPLMITEFASANMGGDKNQWVYNMLNIIKEYDRIKVAVWWNGYDWDKDGNVARSYVIDETLSLLELFKRYLKEPWDKDVFA